MGWVARDVRRAVRGRIVRVRAVRACVARARIARARAVWRACCFACVSRAHVARASLVKFVKRKIFLNLYCKMRVFNVYLFLARSS